MEGFEVKIDPIWKHKDVVGIDIGTRSLKLVQLKKVGGLTRLIGYGQIQIPENYVIEGIIAEPEKLAELIKSYCAKGIWGQITAKRVCTSLPESKIFTHTISLPQMSEKELEEAVSWDASQTIPMSMTDLYMDWSNMGPSDEDPTLNEIFYAAAPRAIVDSYIQLFQILGLEMESLETSLTAIIRAMVSKKDSKKPILVIDIGGQTSNLAVFDGVIRVTGSTLIGGEHLTYKISQVLGVTEKEAESIKKNQSIKEIEKIRDSLDTEITEMTKEATRMINYFQEKNKKSEKVQKILLCGGSAGLPTLAETMQEKLGLPTSVGNPWENISIYPLKTVPHEDAPAFTNAVGLALLGVKDE